MSEDVHNSNNAYERNANNTLPSNRTDYLYGILMKDDILALETWDRTRYSVPVMIGEQIQLIPRF